MLGIPNSMGWFWHRPTLRYWPAFVLALLWTLVWGLVRLPLVCWRLPGTCRRYAVAWAFAWGRRECPEPVVCSRCGWAGPRRWAIHAYRDDGTGEDVDPVDQCPRCAEDV